MSALPRPLSLRGRLLAALLVFSAVGLAIFAGTSVLLLRHSLMTRVDEQLFHLTGRIADAPPLPVPAEEPALRLPSDFHVTFLWPDGRVEHEMGQSGGPASRSPRRTGPTAVAGGSTGWNCPTSASRPWHCHCVRWTRR